MASRAKESRSIQKARAKLTKQLEEENKKITASALYRMSEGIRRWITRHSSDRINLKDKTLTLFDENRHPAKTQSNFVNNLLGKLKNSSEERVDEPSSLIGRIKK